MRNKPPLTAAAVRRQAALVAALRRLDYLTPAQASCLPPTSVSTIQKACRSAALASVSVGRTYRIRPQSVDDWLAAQRRTLRRVS